jgi:hypothetical protein
MITWHMDWISMLVLNGSRMQWLSSTYVFLLMTVALKQLTSSQNRVANHSPLLDWNSVSITRSERDIADLLQGERRHLARLTPQAERPYETPFEPAEESLAVSNGN